MTLPTNITVGDPGHAGIHNAERAAINAKPDDFVDLGDTPASLAGEAGKTLVVNTAGTALELASPAAAVLSAANVQTASYTLVAADAGKAVEMDVASANTLTVPPNSSVALPAGTVVEVVQVGAGQTTIVAGSGVTVDTPETLALSGQWATVWLRKRATDGWVAAGDFELAGS